MVRFTDRLRVLADTASLVSPKVTRCTFLQSSLRTRVHSCTEKSSADKALIVPRREHVQTRPPIEKRIDAMMNKSRVTKRVF